MPIKLKNQHPGIQFAVFFSITVAMLLANIVISSFYFGDLKALMSDKPLTDAQLATFRWSQVITTVLCFMAPPLIFAYVSDDERPLKYIGIKKRARIKTFLITILLLIVVQPFAMLLSDLNQRIDIGETLRQLEEANTKATAKFLVMNSTTDLLINMIVVAILPAISEELFFRGGLQNILERWTQRPAIAIILSSAFFAFFHLSFFKFLPIFSLGLTLGILFYITRNLWYSILFHFVNNSLALLQSYYAPKNEMLKRLSSDEIKLHWSIALLSLALTIMLFVYLRKRYAYRPLEKHWKSANMFGNHFNTPS